MSQFGTAGNKAQDQLNGAIGLVIEHVPTCQAILFRRIKIKSFSDKLDTKWKEEEVFGRMDPITTYQATSRTISFSFDIGDDTIENMHYALIGVSTLMNFQYPTYESAPNALTLSRPPLLRVRFANYITDGNGGPLLCAMKGMSYDPVDNFDIGKNPRVVDGTLVPVRISVNMELRVLHESASRSFLNGKSVVFGKLTARRPPTASTTETNVNGVTQAQADKDNTPPAESQAALIDGEFWTGANDSGISNSDALDQNYNEQLFSDAAAQNAANLDSSRTRMTVNERFWSYPFITDDVFPRRGDK